MVELDSGRETFCLSVCLHFFSVEEGRKIGVKLLDV